MWSYVLFVSVCFFRGRGGSLKVRCETNISLKLLRCKSEFVRVFLKEQNAAIVGVTSAASTVRLFVCSAACRRVLTRLGWSAAGKSTLTPGKADSCCRRLHGRASGHVTSIWYRICFFCANMRKTGWDSFSEASAARSRHTSQWLNNCVVELRHAINVFKVIELIRSGARFPCCPISTSQCELCHVSRRTKHNRLTHQKCCSVLWLPLRSQHWRAERDLLEPRHRLDEVMHIALALCVTFFTPGLS